MSDERFRHLYGWLLNDTGGSRVGKAQIAKIIEEFRDRNAKELEHDYVDEDVVGEGQQIQQALLGLIADGLCDEPMECIQLVAEGTTFDPLHRAMERLKAEQAER